MLSTQAVHSLYSAMVSSVHLGHCQWWNSDRVMTRDQGDIAGELLRLCDKNLENALTRILNEFQNTAS